VAYKTTTEAKTAKVDLEHKVSLPARTTASGQTVGPTTFRITGQGVVDFENEAADVTGWVDFEGERADATAQMGLGELEVRRIGGIVYEKFPDRLASRMPGQKPWIKLDLDAMMREQYGTSLSELEENAPNDPAEQLGYLQGVSDSVEEVGTEEVRGAPATHYRATADLEKAAAQQGAQQNAQIRQAYDNIEQQLGTSTLPIDAWLDDQGRVVRLETNMPMPVPAGSSSQYAGESGEGQSTLTEEYYDFGTPVSVEPPPEDQTADINELRAARLGSSS
jgi:hypothetical protein